MKKIERIKLLVPTGTRSWLRRRRQEVGRKMLALDRVTDFNVLRRLTPYRDNYGQYRGQVIDRYYIEKFLALHEGKIRGHVLEVCDSAYTRRFGGPKVTRSEVLDIDTGNSRRTITTDLTNGLEIADGSFDCVILTQTLPYIYDVAAVASTVHRILRPGGAVLASVPGITRHCPPVMRGAGEEYWHFTRHSAQRLFADVFGEANVSTVSYGNVLAASAFLHGLVAEELTAEELEYHDPNFEVTITVCACK